MSVQCNTEQKLRSTFSDFNLCDRLNLRKKQVCLCSLAVCAYEISHRTGIFPRIRIRQ